jgi:type IV secretion system protein TrbL
MKSTNILRLAAFATLLGLVASSATAQGIPATAVDATTVLGMLKASMAPAINKLTSLAISWLGAFSALQILMTNYKLLLGDSDLQAVIAKAVGAVAWVGICILFIQQGPSFISAVGDSFFVVLGLQMPSPGTIIQYTLGAAGMMAALAVGGGAIPGIGDTVGLLLVCMTLLVLGSGMFFAFKIFMVQLELALIVMLSPLSFSLLGLSTLRDQGIAPFKALLSLAYRIILLTVILSAFGEVSSVLKTTISGINKTNFILGAGEATEALVAAASAYLLVLYLVFKSDSIAAKLSSGTTSMGTADVASAAAASAAVGAAVASGGAAISGAASAAPQTMREFMGSMAGGNGSINNASAMGSADPSPLRLPAGQTAFSTTGQGGSMAGSGGQTGPAGAGSSSPASTASAAQPGAAQTAHGNDSTLEVADAAARPQAQSIASSRIGPDLSSEGGSGSGQGAGISGANDMAGLTKQLGRLADQMEQQGQSQGQRKPTFGDRLADANRQVEKEQDRVQVSVNPHHHD